jgi:urocanate hydratase
VRAGLRAGIAAGAGAIVDDERLSQRLRRALKQDSGYHVARAAARKRKDDLDRARRVTLQL